MKIGKSDFGSRLEREIEHFGGRGPRLTVDILQSLKEGVRTQMMEEIHFMLKAIYKVKP